MKRVTSITIACVLAVLAGLVTQIRAQQVDTQDRTIMTFNSAVELPGIRLEPGTYEFRLADTPARNVVQVFRKADNDKSAPTTPPVGQFTFAQAERERSSEETVVMFREAPEGQTPAVQYWYFPGEKIGKEFIYPKDQAERIAARTGRGVLTSEGRIDGDARADASATTPGGAQAGVSASPAGVSASASASDAATSDDALRNAPSPAQPTAAAGSTAGNRGVTSEPARTTADNTSAASSDDALRNAPSPAQPTAAAGSTAGNRGVTSEPERAAADRAAADPISRAPEATTARAEAQAQPQTRVDAELEPAPRAVGTSGQAAADQQADNQATRANELPATASPLPLAGLIGLLSLAGAAGMRYVRS